MFSFAEVTDEGIKVHLGCITIASVVPVST